MGLSTGRLLKNANMGSRIIIEGKLLIKMQKILLEAVKEFARVCDKYGFYYSLCGGSALGAVRHQGFIPWDDDIDVFMVRKDYNEFLKIFEKELGEKYYLRSMETTPENGYPLCQIMVKGTLFRNPANPECKDGGVFIDICILENAPNNIIVRTIHGMGSQFFGFALSCSRFYRNKETLLETYKDADVLVINAIKRKAIIGRFFSFFSLEAWATHYWKWNALCKNDNSKYVVCPTGVKHYFKEVFPREIYCVTKKMKFEDTELEVIENYDWALTRLYGDYMKIPPKENREKHSVLAISI